MSSAGQVIGGIVGAVAGFMYGGPAGAYYGFQIGMTIGGVLDPPKLPDINGPRISDLTMQTATYGAPMPRLYGTIAVNGNVFWLENDKYKEVIKKTKSGGKGGSTQTTKTASYYATFAVGLAHRPSNPVVGVRRIWLGADLFYDAGSSDAGAVRASNEATALFNLHKGDAAQSADDRMQATLGMANTSAYRGLCYIVFKDLPLAKYGNSLAGVQVKVEIVVSGSESYVETDGNTPYIGGQYQLQAAYADFGGVAISKAPAGGSYYLTTKDGVNWTPRNFPYAGSWRAIGAKSDQILVTLDYDKFLSTKNGVSWTLSNVTYVAWNGFAWNGKVWIAGANGRAAWSLDGVNWNEVVVTGMTQSPSGVFCHNSRGFIVYDGQNGYLTTDDNGVSWQQRTFPFASNTGVRQAASNGSIIVGQVKNNSTYTYSTDGGDTWAAEVAIGTLTSTLSICYGSGMFCFYGQSSGGGKLALSRTGLPGSWSFISVAAALGATLFSDRTVDYTGFSFAGVPTNGGTACFSIVPNVMSGSGVAISTVISNECLLSPSLSALDIDVTSLTKSTKGYKVTNPAPIRNGLETLQGAFPFDVIQRGYKITFKERGGASVATIKASELAAIEKK